MTIKHNFIYGNSHADGLNRNKIIEEFHSILNDFLDIDGNLQNHAAIRFKATIQEKPHIIDAHKIRQYIFQRAATHIQNNKNNI